MHFSSQFLCIISTFLPIFLLSPPKVGEKLSKKGILSFLEICWSLGTCHFEASNPKKCQFWSRIAHGNNTFGPKFLREVIIQSLYNLKKSSILGGIHKEPSNIQMKVVKSISNLSSNPPSLHQPVLCNLQNYCLYWNETNSLNILLEISLMVSESQRKLVALPLATR